MSSNHASVIVSLNASPTLEGRLTDWLLERDERLGFTSFAAHGHGSHGPLSIAEQVSGRQKRVELRVELAADELAAFLAGLRNGFGGADVYYVVCPVIASGHLRAEDARPPARGGGDDGQRAG
jgi:hypothetical protein